MLDSKKHYSIFISFLLVSILLGGLLALVIGSQFISLRQVLATLYKQSFSIPSHISLYDSIIYEIRLPRILLSLLVGASLGCAGVVTQGLFRNPLASPGTLGVSSGAAVTVVIGMSLGIDSSSIWITPLLAAIGSIVTLIILYALSYTHHNLLVLVLIGVALAMMFNSTISFLLAWYNQDYSLLLKTTQWLLGSFEGRGWSFFWWGLPFFCVGLIGGFYLSKALDVLHIGVETAFSLGIHIRITYLLGICVIGLLVGTATALVGVISFVGLIVPHIARFIVGAMHSRLLFVSMLLGGILLLCVDMLSRISWIYLPPGVISSLLGAPFFLWLIYREKHYA